jgi:hypothetical protein
MAGTAMNVGGEGRLEALRAYTGFAISRIKAAGVVAFCEAVNRPLRTGPDNLRKFANDKNASLNRDDVEALNFFFYRTWLGRALRELKDRQGKVPGIVTTSVSIAVTQAASAAAEDKRAADLVGWYFVHHGSHLVPDHFVVRAMSVEIDVDGFMVVEDRLLDEKTLSGKKVHVARGIAGILNGQPQFLMMRQDNSVGFNLIVGDQVTPTQGPIETLSGTVVGMTRTLRPFNRGVLLVRTEKGMALDDLVAQTGIMPFAEWPPRVRERFRELARQYPSQEFEDPVLGLRVQLK